MPKVLTDEEVEREIEKLRESPYYKLFKKDEQIRLRRRKYLYQLRCYVKKGMELAEAGITMEMLDRLDSEMRQEDDN